MNFKKALAPRLLKAIGIGTLALTTLACNAGLELRPKTPTFEAQAEFGGVSSGHAVATPAAAPASYESAPAEAGPTAGNYVQSGGGSVETAELTTAGATILGRVAEGAPRFYAIDLAVGDSLSFKVYTRLVKHSGAGTNVSVVLMEPDMVKLGSAYTATYASGDELERDEFDATASQAGRHYLKIGSRSKPAEYRIEITGVNQAAR